MGPGKLEFTEDGEAVVACGHCRNQVATPLGSRRTLPSRATSSRLQEEVCAVQVSVRTARERQRGGGREGGGDPRGDAGGSGKQGASHVVRGADDATTPTTSREVGYMYGGAGERSGAGRAAGNVASCCSGANG